MVEDGRIELPLHACKAHVLPLSLIPQIGRSREIRTPDPLVPNQMRYQTALYSVIYTGAPWQNRTAVTWLQNRCNAIILIGLKLQTGSRGRDRTYDQLINSQLHYRCATLEWNWLRVKDSNLRLSGYEPDSLTSDVTR